MLFATAPKYCKFTILSINRQAILNSLTKSKMSEYFISWCLSCEKQIPQDCIYCSRACQSVEFCGGVARGSVKIGSWKQPEISHINHFLNEGEDEEELGRSFTSASSFTSIRILNKKRKRHSKSFQF